MSGWPQLAEALERSAADGQDWVVVPDAELRALLADRERLREQDKTQLQEILRLCRENERLREALERDNALIVAAFRVAAVASDVHEQACEDCAVGSPCEIEAALLELDEERRLRAAAVPEERGG